MTSLERGSNFKSWQLVALIGLAVGFWFNGVILIRLITSHALWGGAGSATIFALSLPIATLSIVGVGKLLKLTREQLAPGIILIVAVVTLLHGIALTWIPSIYGTEGESLLFASSWLIWFCGAVLLSLFFMRTSGAQQ
jgi:hypothetical protein